MQVCVNHMHLTTVKPLNGCYDTSGTMAVSGLTVSLMTHRWVENIDSLDCRLSCLLVAKHQIYPLMKVL